MSKIIIAVDFDGTLSSGGFPGFGEPNISLINSLLAIREKVILILWTCRAGVPLYAAVEWCRNFGLEFDYVNENAKQSLDQYGVDCRKILADYYIDDRAVYPDDLRRLTDEVK